MKTEFLDFRFKNKVERNGCDWNVRGCRLINKVQQFKYLR